MACLRLSLVQRIAVPVTHAHCSKGTGKNVTNFEGHCQTSEVATEIPPVLFQRVLKECLKRCCRECNKDSLIFKLRFRTHILTFFFKDNSDTWDLGDPSPLSSLSYPCLLFHFPRYFSQCPLQCLLFHSTSPFFTCAASFVYNSISPKASLHSSTAKVCKN